MQEPTNIDRSVESSPFAISPSEAVTRAKSWLLNQPRKAKSVAGVLLLVLVCIEISLALRGYTPGYATGVLALYSAAFLAFQLLRIVAYGLVQVLGAIGVYESLIRAGTRLDAVLTVTARALFKVGLWIVGIAGIAFGAWSFVGWVREAVRSMSVSAAIIVGAAIIAVAIVTSRK
jgi:hypothetical protein